MGILFTGQQVSPTVGVLRISVTKFYFRVFSAYRLATAVGSSCKRNRDRLSLTLTFLLKKFYYASPNLTSFHYVGYSSNLVLAEKQSILFLRIFSRNSRRLGGCDAHTFRSLTYATGRGRLMHICHSIFSSRLHVVLASYRRRITV